MSAAGDSPAAGVHATCVAFDDIGILLRGDSGAGKSDLALRLIEAGAVLVADDRVVLQTKQDALSAAPPRELAGKLEVRGLGLVSLPWRKEVTISLLCDLVSPDDVSRMPENRFDEYLGVRLARIKIAAFEQSAVAKIRLAAYDASGRPDPVTGARRHDEDEPVK